ncbi:Auxin-induced protein 10A5 [Bienertia sinuspersici]
MKIQIGEFLHAKQVRQFIFSVRQRLSKQKLVKLQVPQGHFVIYVGDQEEKKRFVVPISYLKNALFQELLRNAAEEFGYDHGSDGLIVPCSEFYFLNLISQL